MSHPSWVCGLKQKMILVFVKLCLSHPSWVCGLKHRFQSMRSVLRVTPFVGVWIETCLLLSLCYFGLSHPSWVCGLKLVMLRLMAAKQMSHPSWVCGLKLCFEHLAQQPLASHPSWVCGLKQSLRPVLQLSQRVTPFVGVWIETREVSQ